MLPELGGKTLGSEWISMALDTDIYGYRAFSEAGEELGFIQDYIFDENARLRYLVLETGLSPVVKKVLVPAGLCRVNDVHRSVILIGLSQDLIAELPPFENIHRLDDPYETLLLRYYNALKLGLPAAEDAVLFKPPERLEAIEDRLLDELPRRSATGANSRLSVHHYPNGQGDAPFNSPHTGNWMEPKKNLY